MKKAIVKLFLLAFLAASAFAPAQAVAEDAEKAPSEKKAVSAAKKTKKKKAAKSVDEEVPAVAISELKLDMKAPAAPAPAAIADNAAPASAEAKKADAGAPAAEPKKAKAAKKETAETFKKEDTRSGETYIPTSANISGLMADSNDLSILLPQDTGGRWGLVLGYNYYKFTDEDKSSAVADTPTGADSPDLRLYVSKKFDNKDSYYMRLRYARLNLKGDNNLAVPNSKNIGLKFDMLYYTFQRRPDVTVRVGRQFLKVGRGFTYANIHDGIMADKALPKWYLQGFVSRTQPRESNVDQSNAGYLNRSFRTFYAAEASYLGLKNKKLYGYALFEKDGNVKIPYVVKDYTYDANYFGLGLDGSFKPNWPYYLEYVMQGGKTASNNVNTGTDSIKANAYYLGTEYFFKNDPKKSFATLEYAHASGDPDRTSVTNVIGGNTAGTSDKNFMPFGIYDLGLALHPRFSNINVLKIGGFMKPFYRSPYTKELQLGLKYMIYTKDSSTGLMSDAVATTADKNLGKGYDLYLTWRLLSDTLIYVNYGVFTPGNAYPANRRDNTKMLNFGTTLFF